MATFQSKEEEGRKDFEDEWGAYPITWSEEDTSRWDAEIETEAGTYQVEIKARDVSSDTYPSWILECKKAEALSKRERNKDHVDGTLYFNSFTDGKTLTWDLAEVEDPDVQYKSCPKTTVKANGRRNKKLFMLSPEQAINNL